jgi:hypothetical protein
MMLEVTMIEKKKLKNLHFYIFLFVFLFVTSAGLNIYTIRQNVEKYDEIARQQLIIDTLSFEKENLTLSLMSKEDRISKVAAFIRNVRPVLSNQEARLLAEYHLDSSVKYNVPVSIGLAINKQETHFDCSKTSYNNTSYGCMQINYNAQKVELGLKSKEELFIASKNIDYGYQVIRNKLKQSNGDMRQALWRYYGWKKDETFHFTYATEVLQKAYKIKEILV